MRKDEFYENLKKRLQRYAKALFAGSAGMYMNMMQVANRHSGKLKEMEHQLGFLGENFWTYGINSISDGNSVYSNLDIAEIEKVDELNKHLKYNLFWLLTIKIELGYIYVSIFCLDTVSYVINSNTLDKYSFERIENVRLRTRGQRAFVDIVISGLDHPVHFEIDPNNRPLHTGPKIVDEINALLEQSKDFHSEPVATTSKEVLTHKDKMLSSLPTIVILTAIQEEYIAVRNHLREIEDADQNDTSYEAGIFERNGKRIAKVVIRECGARNTIASQETERAIQYFKPDSILFVGIAGSRKPNDFSVGDVVFPEKIYSYEGGKSEKDAFLARPDLVSTNYALMEIAKKERRKDDWKSLIKQNWGKDVKADLGVIASGEQIVEHFESEIGKILTSHFNDTSAVEMEGFGFAKAALRQGRETGNIAFGVIRGISDIIGRDQRETNVTSHDRRPQNAKQFASDTAAAFAYWLMFRFYQPANE